MTLFKTNTKVLFVLCTILLSLFLIESAHSQFDELKVNLSNARGSKFKATYIPPEGFRNDPIQFRRYSRLCYFPLLKHSFISKPKAYDSNNQRIKVNSSDDRFIPQEKVAFWEYFIDASKFPEYINLPLRSTIISGKSALIYPSLFYPFLDKPELSHRIAIKDDISKDSSTIERIDFEEYLDIDEFIYSTYAKQLTISDSIDFHINLLGRFNKLDEFEIQSIIEQIVLAFKKTTGKNLPQNFEFNISEASLDRSNKLPVSAVYKNSITVMVDKSFDEYQQKTIIIENSMWQLFRWLSPIHSHDSSWAYLDPKNGKHSIHLWYYEAVTEYLSLICLIKNKLISESYFTQTIQKKVSRSLKEPSYSLIQLGKDFSSQSGKIQIKNNLKAYDVLSNRGVIAALIMDIVLLNESNGYNGLLQEYLNIHKTYESDAFPTDRFISLIAKGHSKDFKIVLEKYVLGIDQFHLKSYFELIDWQFFRKGEIHKSFMKRGHLTYFPEIEKYVCTSAGKNNVGLEKGDIILSINNDTQISTFDLNEIILPAKGGFRNENRVKIEIFRDGKEMVLRGKAEFKAKVKNDIIIPLFNPSSDGYQLRKSMIH
ncbi:hypothetical protein HZR84_04420 [Hyphobacterium sp. CCMP332]|nr:hypothetical protein HZR84_04420 [Hyphobacterium sp. CCMP332]